MNYSVLKDNLYQQPGGEDESVRSECALLSGNGLAKQNAATEAHSCTKETAR
jgi:hypothetical protein